MVKRYLSLLFVLLLFPILGVLTSFQVTADMEQSDSYQHYQVDLALCDQKFSDWRSKKHLPSFSFLQGRRLIGKAEPEGFFLPEKCRQWRQADQLKIISFGLGGAGLFFLFFYWSVAFVAKSSKARMVFFFPKLVRFSLLFLALLMLGHGVLVALGIDLIQSFYMTKNYWWLTVFLVLGALSVVFKLFAVLVHISKPAIQHVFGKRLSELEYPQVHALISGVAQRLNAHAPDNIVVGFETDFFVTSQPLHVYVDKEQMEGSSLYLSLPLCRLLSLEEIITIVGHELGHFREGDTEYTLKFSPVYRGVEKAIFDLHNEDGSLSLWSMLPANMLFFMQYVFLEAEGQMSKDREFEADKAAMEVASPHAMATSLMKLSLFSFLWEETIEQNSLRLERGLYTRNLSSTFANIVRYDVAHDKAFMSIDEMLQSEISHPSDTHPTTEERILAINDGVLPEFDKSDFKIPDETAITVFDNYQALEEELTLLEHLYAVDMLGVILPPKEEGAEADVDNFILFTVYQVIAGLITADGEIHETEIEVAENVAFRLIPDFDPVDFREACHNPEDFDDIWGIARDLAITLSASGRGQFVDMLLKIANADARYLESEHSYIAHIQKIFDEVDQKAAQEYDEKAMT